MKDIAYLDCGVKIYNSSYEEKNPKWNLLLKPFVERFISFKNLFNNWLFKNLIYNFIFIACVPSESNRAMSGNGTGCGFWWRAQKMGSFQGRPFYGKYVIAFHQISFWLYHYLFPKFLFYCFMHLSGCIFPKSKHFCESWINYSDMLCISHLCNTR